ncbi:hypothetical protein [Klebsiella quasipneumoniae]|uniref:hypothetical protein n=1 Tax=Klebsiella quasipneumoniae TaxID=1463165 RepID=UPI00296F8399|nr:hypothetical protein [Klebsiella quasipneumoniae]MDW3821488.1 hypothetical protein [Klebsiella quasipneumoniae]
MKSKTGDSWAEFLLKWNETDKEIAEVSRQLALSEEEDKALLLLEAEPLAGVGVGVGAGSSGY